MYFVYDGPLDKVIGIQKKEVNYWVMFLHKLQKELLSKLLSGPLPQIINKLKQGNYKYFPEKVLDLLLFDQNPSSFWSLKDEIT